MVLPAVAADMIRWAGLLAQGVNPHAHVGSLLAGGLSQTSSSGLTGADEAKVQFSFKLSSLGK